MEFGAAVQLSPRALACHGPGPISNMAKRRKNLSLDSHSGASANIGRQLNPLSHFRHAEMCVLDGPSVITAECTCECILKVAK